MEDLRRSTADQDWRPAAIKDHPAGDWQRFFRSGRLGVDRRIDIISFVNCVVGCAVIRIGAFILDFSLRVLWCRPRNKVNNITKTYAESRCSRRNKR
jgi:hypothetical protein